MLHDMLFKVEKKAIAADMATQEAWLIKAQHYADMIMELAKEMNLVDEHDSYRRCSYGENERIS